MADPRKELREVKEELSLIEQQLEELLERQSYLIDRKGHLEQEIKDSAATAVTPSDGSSNSNYSKKDFDWSAKLEQLRKSVFKIEQLRPLQLQTMNATLAGKDCILIMPTGGGKSLCFQLPALVSKGITLVISPLVSLMEDQLMSLHALGVQATLLNASSTKEEVKSVQDAMTDPKSPLKLLYVTPEKLAKSKRFMNKLEKMYDMGRFARIVIDEVHCCSQWGHDFRPDYKFLGVLKRQFPGVAILGLTATATTNVVQDVKKILSMPECIIFKASFNRKNLYYEVRRKPSGLEKQLVDMKELIQSRFHRLSGIVYCFSRKDSEDVTRGLQSRGIRAGCYHADMPAKLRSQVHTQWIQNKIEIVVATVAFGMGIDKPDVRFVIHHSLSKSMENYYQESGRAGRDDKKAYCILYTSFSDIFRQSTMVFTEQVGLDNLYGMVAYARQLCGCRRGLIAKHFGERWDSSQCHNMCDLCDPSTNNAYYSRDITTFIKNLVALLKNATKSNQRMTGLKLLDAWNGRGATNLRMSSVAPPKMSPENCERVITYLILNNYLKEDFHFTPYSTISYIVPGPKSMLVLAGQKLVEIEFPSKTKAATSSPGNTATNVKQSTENLQKKSPGLLKAPKTANISKPVVINPENSKFTTTAVPKGEFKVVKAKKKAVVKRKIVIESDSDEDFDFGDIGVDKSKPVPKRPKKAKMEKTSSKDSETGCFVIDISDDDMPEIIDSKPSSQSQDEVQSQKNSRGSLERQRDGSRSQNIATNKVTPKKFHFKKKRVSESPGTEKESFNSNSSRNSVNGSFASSAGSSDMEDVYDVYTNQLNRVSNVSSPSPRSGSCGASKGSESRLEGTNESMSSVPSSDMEAIQEVYTKQMNTLSNFSTPSPLPGPSGITQQKVFSQSFESDDLDSL